MKDLVVGIGEALWDVLPDGKKIGGAPANFAYHVSQFGLPGCVVSAVGDDASGAELLEIFDKKGLTYLVEKVAYPTGTVLVELDGAGIPRYDITEDVAWDNIPFTADIEEIARNTRAVCFGSLAQRNAVSRDTISRFLDAMPKTGTPLVVFDINLRQHYYGKDLLDSCMSRCNVLKINDEELGVVSRMFDIADDDMMLACRRLLNRYDLKMLILTCGINGSYVFTPDGVSYMPTPLVEVADTVGAGDSFTAAFIASILKGKTVHEAHAIAVETSAFVCTQNGAMPRLPEEITSA